jgi:hypothetical protein
LSPRAVIGVACKLQAAMLILLAAAARAGIVAACLLRWMRRH